MVRKRSHRRQARLRRRFGLALPRMTMPVVSVGVRPHLSWSHLISVPLLAACIGLMVMIARGDEYYVTIPEVSGARFVPVQEVVDAAAVSGLHVFWVDPAQVAAAVREAPNVADARVSAVWPNRVTIEVAERDPALVWVDGETVRWADATGRLIPLRGHLEGLLMVIAEQGAISDTHKLPQDLVAGALELRALVPQVTELRYAAVGGLAFEDARGWTAYFGVGAGMAQKLAIYNALVASVEARGLQPLALVVDDVRHPYYRLPPPTPTPGP
jgi:cell division septal protein FtsQ